LAELNDNFIETKTKTSKKNIQVMVGIERGGGRNNATVLILKENTQLCTEL
jgi:hypothetical protein